MTSDEGLNAYGAVTWGQFFIYQGFNDHAGWMHTTSGVDDVDEYLETVIEEGRRLRLPVRQRGAAGRPPSKITVPYKTASGMAKKEFTVYRTQHGPIVRERDGKWVAIRLMQEPVKALTQSYTRTKATDYKSFRRRWSCTPTRRTTRSSPTPTATSPTSTAIHPRRDPKFDWTKPVDGSDPATDWKGLLSVDETPHLLNPASGWLYNSNNWPWSAAGPSSPKKADFPGVRGDRQRETPRGLHAIRVLEDKKDFTLDVADRGGVRQLPAGVRAADSAAAQGLGRDARRPIR